MSARFLVLELNLSSFADLAGSEPTFGVEFFRVLFSCGVATGVLAFVGTVEAAASLLAFGGVLFLVLLNLLAC